MISVTVCSVNKRINFKSFWFIYRLIPESIPWLIAKKNYHGAKKVTKWAAKINSIPFPQHLFDDAEKEGEETVDKSSQALVEGEPEYRYTFLDLFRTPVIRRYTIITFYL